MPKKRWWGVALDSLREDYEANREPVSKVVRRHRTSENQLYVLAKKHGWVNRNMRGDVSSLKVRRRILSERIKKCQKELTHLEQKIQFLEVLNR